MPVGTHLSRCTRCTGAWRILHADGSPSPGLRWSDPARNQSVADVLLGEGVPMSGGRAHNERRVGAAQLRTLAGLDELD